MHDLRSPPKLLLYQTADGIMLKFFLTRLGVDLSRLRLKGLGLEKVWARFANQYAKEIDQTKSLEMLVNDLQCVTCSVLH